MPCFSFLTLLFVRGLTCRSGIITTGLWGGWTNFLVQDYVWMPKTLKILMLQCFAGNNLLGVVVC